MGAQALKSLKDAPTVPNIVGCKSGANFNDLLWEGAFYQ